MSVLLNKALFIVSSTAQVKMFKTIITELSFDFEVKVINTDKYFIEIDNLLREYKFQFETLDDWTMETVNDILEKEKPNIIVTGNDQNMMDVIFIEAANNRNLPSLTVQDGILVADRKLANIDLSLIHKMSYITKIPLRLINFLFLDRHPIKYKISAMIFDLKYRRKHPFLYGHGNSSKIALFSKPVKDMLISEGVSNKKLEVTGNPKFDELIYYNGNSKKELYKEKWGIDLEKKVVLVLTQCFVEVGLWNKEQRKEFISSIAEAVSKLDNVQLVIKLHPPHEKKEDYIMVLENFDFNPIIFDGEPLNEIISTSDVVISVSSTAALEAMALKKPIIIVNLFGDDTSFFKNSGSFYVDHREEIICRIKELLAEPELNNYKRNIFVNEQIHLLDGKAYKRISNLIRSMVKD